MTNTSQGGATEGNPANGGNDALLVDQGFFLELTELFNPASIRNKAARRGEVLPGRRGRQPPEHRTENRRGQRKGHGLRPHPFLRAGMEMPPGAFPILQRQTIREKIHPI